MKFYTVHKPAVPSQDTLDQVDELVFVREGFTWKGFLFAPVWLLFNRLWIEAGLFIIVFYLLSAIVQQVGLAPQASGIIWIFGSLLVGFEGHNLVRWNLDRQEYQMIGTISGMNQHDCELRFFTYWKPTNNNVQETEAFIPGTPAGTARITDL